MPDMLLDRNYDANPPDGYVIIESEMEFLDKALSGQPLFICGQRLCDWAQAFFDGREIPYHEAFSLARALVDTFAGLSKDQARIICGYLEGKAFSTDLITPSSVLNVCFPIPLWDKVPSTLHAAKWLLWIDEVEPEEAFYPILKAKVQDWMQTDPLLGELYYVVDATAARNLLSQWLGAQINPLIEKFGLFPIPNISDNPNISDKWVKTLETSWRKEIVKTEGKFLGEFLQLPTRWEFKQKVAIATLDYFEKHADSKQFTAQIYDQIARFVSGNDSVRLRTAKPVATPTDVPDDPERVLTWYRKEYLPFREWQVAMNVEGVYSRVLELGEQFAKWYLDFYPKALISKKHLSFFKSKMLKEQDSTCVNLFIILDGLHALDAKFIMAELLKWNGNQRLGMAENSFCFAPLPTVTDFAKGALIHGVQPTLMKEFDLLGEDVSEQQTPLPKLLTAKPGSLFMWRMQDPDRTYHTKNRSSMLKKEVEGELLTIVQKITDVVEKVTPSIPLRLIITTDHGRFLGTSKRTIKIPVGMEAHGRAAWGKTNLAFDKSGYKIDGEIVYLSKDRFGLLADDAAVVLTDNAFQHETYDQEISTHGGLFPEEVVIPWMIFERNISRPDLDITISGESQANQPGKIKFAVTNPSSLNVTIVKLELTFGGEKSYDFNLSLDVPGLDPKSVELDIESWPSSEQVALGKGLIVVQLASGEEYSISKKLSTDELIVSEIYTRDKTLFEGLDL